MLRPLAASCRHCTSIRAASKLAEARLTWGRQAAKRVRPFAPTTSCQVSWECRRTPSATSWRLKHRRGSRRASYRCASVPRPSIKARAAMQAV